MNDYSSFTLKYQDIVLVPLEEKWAENIFAEFDSDVTKYMYPSPAKDISETLAFVRDGMNKSKCGTDIYTVITDCNGNFLGLAGLHKVNTSYPELGLWTTKSSRGHHYGRKAMAALAQYGAKNLPIHGICYPADYRNVASRLIPESMGGILVSRYDCLNLAGDTLHLVEYFIDVHNFH